MQHTPVAQSRFPRLVQRQAEHHAPSQLEYVRIAVVLAVITAIEVAIYYFDISKILLLVGLVILATIKFATVAAFFMHLRFDGKLLTLLFLAGMATAGAVFLVVILTLHVMNDADTHGQSAPPAAAHVGHGLDNLVSSRVIGH